MGRRVYLVKSIIKYGYRRNGERTLKKDYKIAVAGTGYVDCLLQHFCHSIIR